MKFNISPRILNAVFCYIIGSTLCSASSEAVVTLAIGSDCFLHIDYTDEEKIKSLNNGEIQLLGGTRLKMTSLASEDGRTYDLFADVAGLVDASGNALQLDSGNNEVSRYFDTSQPGSGFWSNGVLQLSDQGRLQLVTYSSVKLPEYETSVTVDDLSDIVPYRGTESNIIYRIDSNSSNDKSLEIDAPSSALITSSAGSRVFTSADIQNLSSVKFDNSNTKLFNMGENKTLEFAYLKMLSFNASKYASEGCVAYGAQNSTIQMHNIGNITFSKNESIAMGEFVGGGAIGSSGKLEFSNNGCVTFTENSISSTSTFTGGGALFTWNGNINLSSNGNIEFRKNNAINSDGGAIYIGGISGGTFTVNNNGSVLFYANTADDCGGAIYGSKTSDIELSFNDYVKFEKNEANGDGGAIYGEEYGSNISLNDNGTVLFSQNKSIWNGAAIYTVGNLSIRNNASVIFEKNVSIRDGVYHLNSLDVSGAEVSISAASGNSIEFRDSISIYSPTVNFNLKYGEQNQVGDIIFTGAYTETDLLHIKGSSGTANEIFNSKSSGIYAVTNLYGGRLIITDGAILSGNGLTVAAGASATVRVKNSTLNYGNNKLIFNESSTLSLAGNNAVNGNVQMLSGSNLAFDYSSSKGVTDIIGNLTIEENTSVSHICNTQEHGKNEVLLYVSEAVSGWNNVIMDIPEGKESSCTYTWVNNLLVLNYDANTFNPLYNGSVTHTTPQLGKTSFHHYDSLWFSNISNIDNGAVSGSTYNTVSINNNNLVIFLDNATTGSTLYACGGAISGGNMKIHDNETLKFFRNKAIATEAWDAQGGAIYCAGKGYLNNNGVVEFIDNTSSDTGGAIHIERSSQLYIHDNTSLEFQRNSSGNYSSVFYGGGAIFVGYGSACDMKNNGSIRFCDNTSEYGGGAIDGDMHSRIVLSDNRSIDFTGNVTNSYGAAIQSYGAIQINNNGSVIFRQNAEINNGVYRLRSIYNAGGYTASLSAAKDSNITFYDSIYIGSNLELNKKYNEKEQQGDIIFSGLTTKDDLLNIKKQGVSDEEIMSSRTSEITGQTTLYAGSLKLEDLVILKIEGGLTVQSDSTLVASITKSDPAAQVFLLPLTDVSNLHNAEIAATLEANLILEDGSALTLNNGHIDLGAKDLYLGTNITLNFSTVYDIEKGDCLLLFSNVASANFSNGDSASLYFSGQGIGIDTTIVYENNYVYLSGISMPIPEPTTATLSLLALAGLAARRRRK